MLYMHYYLDVRPRCVCVYNTGAGNSTHGLIVVSVVSLLYANHAQQLFLIYLWAHRSQTPSPLLLFKH